MREMLNNKYKQGEVLCTALLNANISRAQISKPDSKLSGFTLIELMVAIAIAGILAAFAVPIYFDRVEQSRLTEGLGMLTVVAAKMEKDYLDNSDYGTNGTCSVAAPASDNFTFTCSTNNNDQEFTWTASYGADYAYTIDQNTDKVTTKFDGTTSPSSGADCWLIGQGQCY